MTHGAAYSWIVDKVGRKTHLHIQMVRLPGNHSFGMGPFLQLEGYTSLRNVVSFWHMSYSGRVSYFYFILISDFSKLAIKRSKMELTIPWELNVLQTCVTPLNAGEITVWTEICHKMSTQTPFSPPEFEFHSSSGPKMVKFVKFFIVW